MPTIEPNISSLSNSSGGKKPVLIPTKFGPNDESESPSSSFRNLKKKTNFNNTNSNSGGRRRQSNSSNKKNSRSSPSPSPNSSERSSSSGGHVPIPSLHEHLMRSQKERDPQRYYETVQMLGEGSMGSVAKVKKRDSAMGGSARKTFVQEELSRRLCFGTPCFSLFFGFCPPYRNNRNKFSVSTGNSTDDDDDDDYDYENKYSGSNGGGAGTSSSNTSSSRHRKSHLLEPIHEDTPAHQKGMTAAEKQEMFQQNKRTSSTLITYGTKKDVYYALKSIHLDRVKDTIFRAELLNEIAILQRLDHPHIVKAIETFDIRDRLFLVLELCSGGDLYTRDPYTEVQAYTIISAVADAVAYMHSKAITHRDLKFENIMFANPSSFTVKIIDFGLSKKYAHEEYMHDTVGTVYTMAPEVLKGDYDNKADIWSIGVLTFMLLSSSIPFYGKTRNNIIRKILNGKYGFRGPRWNIISYKAKEFISTLLTMKASLRPSANEVLNLSWLKRNYNTGADGADGTTMTPVVPYEFMDRVQATIQTFADYGTLKKLALLVIGYKSTEDEIGMLRKIFKTFDTTRDGEVSYAEFQSALQIYQYTDDELEKMFVAMDMDGTGKVKYSEFVAATIESHGAISEERIADAFDRLDSDDSGYITVKNVMDFLGKDIISKEYADMIIHEADITQDHRISYDEFLALWDATDDHKYGEALEDVINRRETFDSNSIDDDNIIASSRASSVSDDIDTVGSIDSNEMGGPTPTSGGDGGKYFFSVEKEKSIRAGAWI